MATIKFGIFKHRHLQTISRRFWSVVFSGIIAMAILVQIGRQAFPLANDYRHLIAEALSEQLGVTVEIGEISARWRGLRPDLRISQLSIFTSETDESPLFSVGTAYAELSILDSLFQRGFAWRTITFEKFATTFEQKKNNRWRLRGYDGGTDNSQNPFTFDDPLDIFLFGRRVDIRSAELHFIFNDGKKSDITVPTISLENDRYFHRMTADIDIEGSDAIKLVIEGYGDPRNKKEFTASGYLSLNDIPTTDVYNAITGAQNSDSDDIDPGNHGEFNLELWFKGSPALGMTTKGRLRIDGIPERLQKHAVLPHTVRAQLSGVMSPSSQWHMNVIDLNVGWGELALTHPVLGVHGNLETGALGLRTEEFELSAWVAAFNAANEGGDSLLVRAMAALNLRGQLENVDVTLTSKESGFFHAQGYLRNGASNSFRGSPEVKNVFANFSTSAFSGFVDVDVENDVYMHLDKVFAEPFVLNAVKGQLAWRVNPEAEMVYLKSNMLTATSDQKHVDGVFAASLPMKSGANEATMSLALHIDQADAKEYASYLPKKTPKETQNWLKQAVDGGTVSEIDVFYSGSVEKNPSEQPGYQVMASIANATIEYDSKWPAATNAFGTIVIDSNAFRAELIRADMMGNRLKNGVIELVSLGKDSNAISVTTQIASQNIDRAKQFLLKSPLKTTFEPIVNDWSMSGAYSGHLNVLVPLAFTEDKLDYAFEMNLKGNRLHLGDLDLVVDDLSGTITYSKRKLMGGSNLSAEIWGKPVRFDVSSDIRSGDIRVGFEGAAESRDVKDWSKRPEMAFLEGDFSATGYLAFPTVSETTKLEGLTLEFNSTLKGASIRLPEPLGKVPSDQGDYWLQLVVLDEMQRYRMRLNNVFFSELHLNQNSKTPPAMIASLGESLYADLTPVNGLARVTGYLRAANYDDWVAAYDRYSESADAIDEMLRQKGVEVSTSNGLKAEIDLEITKVDFKDILLNDMYLNIEGDETSWRFGMQSEKLAGNITLPNEEGSEPARTKIELTHLQLFDLPEVPESVYEHKVSLSDAPEVPEDVVESVLYDVDLSAMTPMDVTIKQLHMKGVDWGSWSFLVDPIDKGIHIKSLRASVRKLDFGNRIQGADFYWRIENGVHESAFRGKVSTEDVGEALIAWDEERLLTSRSAAFDLDIRWADAPDMFSLTNIVGDIGLNMEQGSFIRGAEAGENPFLRLIALFNFDTLARRLRLDFSDLAAKGFAYDRVIGNMSFDRGIVTLTDPVIVESTSSKMQLAGVIDINSEKVDSALVVTLPVAGNLAVATAFVAGLPAAVGVYVVSKLLGKHVDKVSSINYSVKGSWETPKIRVRKIFDDSAAKDFGRSLMKTNRSSEHN